MKCCNFLVLAVLIAGCAPKDEKTVVDAGGVKVTTKQSDKSTQITTPDGKMEAKGDQVTIEGKDGKLQLNTTVTEADLGYPFYPGSTELPGSSKADANGKSMVSSARLTSDKSEQVLAFYTQKLGKPENMVNSDQQVMAMWKDGKKQVQLMTGKEEAKTTINLIVYMDK